MVVRVVQQSEMLSKIPPLAKLMDAMRDAYEEFSAGNAYVADVQHVHVEPADEDDEGGHACVKSGYIKGKASWSTDFTPVSDPICSRTSWSRRA